MRRTRRPRRCGTGRGSVGKVVSLIPGAKVFSIDIMTVDHTGLILPDVIWASPDTEAVEILQKTVDMINYFTKVTSYSP